jgi:hypothetical protein
MENQNDYTAKDNDSQQDEVGRQPDLSESATGAGTAGTDGLTDHSHDAQQTISGDISGEESGFPTYGSPLGGSAGSLSQESGAFGGGMGDYGNASYGAGTENYGNASYGAGTENYGNASYGTGTENYGNASYGTGTGNYGNPSYGTGTGNYGNPSYGTTGSYGGTSYGGGTGNYGNPAYGAAGGQAYSVGGGTYGSAPVPQNSFAMKLTFSILEMLSCNPITIILGIIACVFTTKANGSHKEGRWQEYRSQAKTATICLWTGFGIFLAGVFFVMAVWIINIGDTGISGEEYVFVEGQRLNIPSDYDTYEDLGYYLGRSDRFETLGPDDIGFYQMWNDDGNCVMWCWFVNNTNSEHYANECDIIGVDVDIFCDGYERYQTAEGLGFFDTKDDFIDVYGRPDDTYFNEDDDSELLCWYLGDGSDPVWQVMEVTFMDGLPYDIDIDYRK